jgi:hypothetical protein
MKELVQIIEGVRKKAFCREIIQETKYVSTCQGILTLFTVICCGQYERVQTNCEIHSINTRQKHNLHMPNAGPTSYQKCVYYAGIKLSSALQSNITILNHDIKVFNQAPKDHLSRS